MISMRVTLKERIRGVEMRDRIFRTCFGYCAAVVRGWTKARVRAFFFLWRQRQ